MTADAHDHEGHSKHQESFGEAFGALKELNETVSTAFADNDSEAAHGPLHDVGHLLESISGFAAKSDLDEAAKETIESNIDTLMSSFGAVDALMHGDDKGKEYSEVSADIDEAIAAIATAAGALAEGHGDHDEHGDHDKDDEHGDHDEDAASKDGDHGKDDSHGDGDSPADGEHSDADEDHADEDHGDDAESEKEDDAAADKGDVAETDNSENSESGDE